MLTNAELIAVAAAAREAIRVELVEMWNMEDVHLPDTLTPGMVRAVVQVLSQDYGVKRDGATLHIAGIGAARETVRAQVDALNREIKQARHPSPTFAPPPAKPKDDDAPKPPVQTFPTPKSLPMPLTKGPAAWPSDTGPRLANDAPSAIVANGNGHPAPEKRPANLDAPPVASKAPPKRPASVWAKRLDITGDLEQVVYALETAETNWRTITNDERRPIVLAVIRWMRATGWRLTQAEADAHRPTWMPTSQAWVVALGETWSDLVAAASKEANI